MIPLGTAGPIIAAPFIGSFLALLAVRLPQGEDVVAARSHCRNCNHALGPLELVPVVSWIAVSGRCPHCDARIGAVYPIVELAALAVAIWASFVVSGPV